MSGRDIELVEDDVHVDTARQLTPASVNTDAETAVRSTFTGSGTPDFGRLEDLAAWWAGRAAAGSAHPSRPRLLVFASADGPTGASALASLGNVGVRHLAVPENLIDAETLGRTTIDDEVDSGTDLLLIGHLGAHVRPLVTALVVHATQTDLVEAMGTDLDDLTWMRIAESTREAVRKLHGCTPKDLAERLGSPDVAALSAGLQQAAVRGLPVLLDGTAVSASALMAQRLMPGASAWWLAAHRSREHAHELALHDLGLDPLIDLGMGLGDGSGALLALPILIAAIEIAQDLSPR